jgi:DNA-binding HxlR family transcriptional regulator
MSGDLVIFNRPWDLALVAQCYLGLTRFDEFQRRLGMSRKTLSQRLKSLVDDDILLREQYQSRPVRFEYRLTDKGRDLFPVLIEIKRWGELWLPGSMLEGWSIEHTVCGRRCSPSTVCDRCGERVRLDDVRIVADPGNG